ncbi:MBL fold metallo-hydrolase [Polaribacter sargassicola]|uniref:MBL fold metallo-hydrolase n=1 Tax=Polaribacter sargassicola TaxID=2836891 RepID=UPI001F17164C|nr:MBL fold metallo-hydrolase [Polaribacter sp. DS7-9]MCG1035920.1 MBL fold metallo-hydrolase [Polaribacter sp. DS7-9]
MNKYYIFFLMIFTLSCVKEKSTEKITSKKPQQKQSIKNTSLILLGTIQDAGSPQIGCEKDCCKDLFKNPDYKRQVISLGLIDKQNNKTYLFDATPDIKTQMKMLSKYNNEINKELTDGIFLTHAHIGHYAGLMYLGKESINSKNVTVYAMPKMKTFISNNGPWSQLVKSENINLSEIKNEETIQLSNKINVTPILVPHRDEYSETVGYRIKGPNKSALFIPDIDKWEKWNKNIIDEIKKVDYAFLDATFYSGKEIDSRDISQIPHPFIIESLEKFKDLSKEEKSKIIFIHFNHTNPVINPNSKESKTIIEQGYKIGRFEDIFEL